MAEIFHGSSSRLSVLALYGSAHFLGLPPPGAPFVFAAICDGTAAFGAILCGAERLRGGA